MDVGVACHRQQPAQLLLVVVPSHVEPGAVVEHDLGLRVALAHLRDVVELARVDETAEHPVRKISMDEESPQEGTPRYSTQESSKQKCEIWI